MIWSVLIMMVSLIIYPKFPFIISEILIVVTK